MVTTNLYPISSQVSEGVLDSGIESIVWLFFFPFPLPAASHGGLTDKLGQRWKEIRSVREAIALAIVWTLQ